MSDLTPIDDRKAAARTAAYARRAAAHAAARPGRAGVLSSVLAGYRGVPLSGYMPIRSEISPMAAMEEAAAHGPVGVPVIEAAGRPLNFAAWEPDCVMVPGPFGATVPATLDWMVPEIVIVPLVAFDRMGNRLGYGGGFYDRTLALLRARGPVLAIGFAYAAQEARDIPVEATDVPLDLVVTETEVIQIPGRG
ncbi:5-formyltetrahydrofolate cyclo-ligase [Pseudooceanicola sp. LIPI14-2-Ac024]|uniref:5-formyltetrahydrofolate cyclo-ligase n=1 Tax=Pseudooceanicola sp. LIPI14-2-Ac024 TaxID=3344875 RepID=UPI0035CF3528